MSYVLPLYQAGWLKVPILAFFSWTNTLRALDVYVQIREAQVLV